MSPILDPSVIEEIAKEDPEYAAQLAREYRKAMIVLARKDPSWFCAYVLKNEQNGAQIFQTPEHEAVHKKILECPRTVIWTYPGFGKCEKHNSKLLCADGTWVKVQDLTEPTKLLTWDERTGKLVTVTGQAHDNGMKHTLAITLSNGAVLNVTENHPIRAADLSWVRADQLTVGQQVVALGHLDLPDTGEASMPEDEAEILGYLLAGRVWRNESVIVRNINKSDKWSARRKELFERAGWTLAPYKQHSFVVTASSRAAMSPAMFLASLTIIERGWPVDFKPEVWKLPTKSVKRLLSGFFACAYFSPDGGRKDTGCPIGGTYGLGNDRAPAYVGHPYRPVLETVRKLLLRVGVTANIRPWVAHKRLGKKGYGGIWKASKRSYDSRFQVLSIPHGQTEFFWPTAKKRNSPSLLCAVTVSSIVRSAVPVQTYGVEVQEEQHSYISEGVLVHNTNQISIGHVLWRIGKDPNTTIAIMCNTSEMAARIVSSIKGYIAHSPEFHDVFPDIKPGETWATSKFTVVRESLRKDPTVQAVGLTGNIVGARLDGLVIDDIDNVDSTLTEASRQQTEQRVRKQGISRLSAEGWAVGIGNVWHEKDCLHRLAASGWHTMRYPVLIPSKDSPGELVSANPAMFPMERIYQIRDFDQGPLEFERLYMLKPRIDGEQRFRIEWIEKALELGRQQVLLREGLPKVPTGCRTILGVDLGVKPKAKNDPTVLTTVLEVPKGNNQYDFQILNIVKGRWNAQEIMDKIKEQQRLFASEVWVESNGAQDFLIQLMNMSGLSYKINAFRTGMNKYDPMFGVEAIAAEMAMGCWWLPTWDGTREGCEEEIDELIEEMLAYQPNNHTGDLLMSLWIARDGARQSRQKKTGRVEFGRLNLRRR